LLVCKWSKLLAVDNDRTNQSVVFEHRNRNDRSCSAESSCQTGNCISRTVSGVDHLLRSVHLVKKATRRGQPKSRLRGSSLRRFQECSEKSLGFFDLWKLRVGEKFSSARARTSWASSGCRTAGPKSPPANRARVRSSCDSYSLASDSAALPPSSFPVLTVSKKCFSGQRREM